MKTNKIALASLAVLTLVACQMGQRERQEDSNKFTYTPETNEVEVITLKRNTFHMQLVANGKLVAAQRSALYFRESGQIVEIDVQNGSALRRGSIIARLDDTEQRVALESARINLERSRLDYLDVLAGLGYSVTDTVSIPAEVRNLAGIRSGFSAARNDYAKAQRALDGTVLRAPFVGKVANLKLKKWDHTDSEPFCMLIADGSFEVTFSALESEYSFLETGQKVSVTPFGSEHMVYGRIVSINPIVDRYGQISVTATIPGRSGLLDGMNVKVTVDKDLSSQLVVPKSAVVIRDGLEVVFRYNDGYADWVYVHTLSANSKSYSIEANLERGAHLEEGDLIIISGNLNLANGSRVVLK
ncbi:MAG: efflux RND transporter periplasmic adaptor subunit [Bacteroidales bacterium]|nr:efflux RND transporter periplasmic adaptor subunit [Bacteroidales bacterium]